MITDTDHRWVLKREFQLGHIITTITVAVSALVYVTKLEQRIAIVETQLASQRERDTQQDRANAEMMDMMRKQLERIDGKLDRLIEKR